MDRMILESLPFRVIEGAAVAAVTIGAEIGMLFVRSEYPLAIKRLRKAIELCSAEGLIGKSVLASGSPFHLELREGGGAFVCGEETALLAALQGQRGNPRARPPYPAESGLYGKPTLVNNVETLATVPWIIRHGAEAFARLGVGNSRGTKTFALAGKINRGGLIEVPMGISVRKIVETIGGGLQQGGALKAVQIGGPSGGCIPTALVDLPVDYERLAEIGTMMGSGGMIVLDESDCMVDIARYFMAFTQSESCGKCTCCRIGTKRMLEILQRLCSGQGTLSDIDQLEALAETVRRGSLCKLGQTAPNPVRSTLIYFRDEYIAHTRGRCPAGRCKALITYVITDQCIGCTRCAQNCPAEAIAMTPYEQHRIDTEKCIRCGTCVQVCPQDAVTVE
jgi:NADH:ubiquinone oxidoreductase subunit F (NADH-binding)